MNTYQTPRLIKSKVKAAIKKAIFSKTDAGKSVFVSRSIPTQHEEAEAQPVILIYSRGESIDRFEEAPKSYKRRVDIAIECIVTGDDGEDLDLKLEQLGEQVEDCMEIDETLGGVANFLELAGSDYTLDSNSQSPTGILLLSFVVELITYARSGECLPDLEKVNTTYEIGAEETVADEVELNEGGN